ADPNTFDDYERGDWTPVFELTSGSLTYSHQVGEYQKKGDYVSCSCWMRTTGRTLPVNIALLMAGLPFPKNAVESRGGAVMYVNASTVTGQVHCYPVVNVSTLAMKAVNDGVSADISAADFFSADVAVFQLLISYFT
ncbi:unnamed protein product, partial [marine sediment metagenome]